MTEARAPAPASVAAAARLRRRAWGRWAGGLLLTAGGVAGILFLDTAARARAAFRRAEVYRSWMQDPEAKRRSLDAEFAREADRLESERSEMTEEARRLERGILQSRHEIRRIDSAAKRAYFGYRDVFRLYAPPETRWSRRARLLAPAAKETWRAEVQAARWPGAELMLDPEPGETENRVVLCSASKEKEAAALAARLLAAGFDVRVVDGRRASGAYSDGWRVTVPLDRFWPAHTLLQGTFSTN